MTVVNKIFPVIGTIFIFIALTGCGSSDPGTTGYKNDNITILIDLSDRIAPKDHPQQIEKDLDAVLEIVKAFKQRIVNKGTFNANDKIKVMFYPQMKDSRIMEIAERLTINLEHLEPREKKIIFKNIDSLYASNLKELYRIAASQNPYSGSDIYNFFKDRVEDDCLLKDSSYLNTLVILSDGYLFWKYGQMKNGNRFSYIGPDAQQVKMFRRNPNWEAAFDKNDYGFIPVKNNFSDLSVLLLEVNPVAAYPEDYDIMKKYWGKWFEEMNVRKYKIVKSDLPVTTRAIVQKYFKEL